MPWLLRDSCIYLLYHKFVHLGEKWADGGLVKLVRGDQKNARMCLLMEHVGREASWGLVMLPEAHGAIPFPDASCHGEGQNNGGSSHWD